jgi:hypothetical protein
MAEVGCVKDVACQNLNVAGESIVQNIIKTGIQRLTTDAAATIAKTTDLVDLAFDVTVPRIITMPPAQAGRHIRVAWSVEQATSNRVFTRAGSDTFTGNITTKVEGNAAGDGDVVVIANTTVAITTIDDVNLGSYLDFYCFVDETWFVTGELIVDVVGSVPTAA